MMVGQISRRSVFAALLLAPVAGFAHGWRAHKEWERPSAYGYFDVEMGSRGHCYIRTDDGRWREVDRATKCRTGQRGWAEHWVGLDGRGSPGLETVRGEIMFISDDGVRVC